MSLSILSLLILAGCSTHKQKNVDFPLEDGIREFVTISNSDYSSQYTPNVEYDSSGKSGCDYLIGNCTIITKNNPDSPKDAPFPGEIKTILNAAGDTLMIIVSISDYQYSSITTYAKFYKECQSITSNPVLFKFEGLSMINVVEMDVDNGVIYNYDISPQTEQAYLSAKTVVSMMPDYDSPRGYRYVKTLETYYPNGQVKKQIDTNGRVTQYTADGEKVSSRSKRQNNYSSTTTFRHESDIHNYLRSHTFTNSRGDISITEGYNMSLQFNGRELTGAIMVYSFDSHQAIFTAHSPINGVTYRFMVDNSTGTLYCDNDNTYYYAR